MLRDVFISASTVLPAFRLAETINVYALPPLIKRKKFPKKLSSPQWSYAVFFFVEVSRRQTSTKKCVTGPRADQSMGSLRFQTKTKSKNSRSLHTDDTISLSSLMKTS